MAKKWRPELWENINLELELPENYYGPSETETRSFYDPQDPKQAYEVRGVRPPSREIKDPEKDAY